MISAMLSSDRYDVCKWFQFIDRPRDEFLEISGTDQPASVKSSYSFK